MVELLGAAHVRPASSPPVVEVPAAAAHGVPPAHHFPPLRLRKRLWPGARARAPVPRPLPARRLPEGAGRSSKAPPLDEHLAARRIGPRRAPPPRRRGRVPQASRSPSSVLQGAALRHLLGLRARSPPPSHADGPAPARVAAASPSAHVFLPSGPHFCLACGRSPATAATCPGRAPFLPARLQEQLRQHWSRGQATAHQVPLDLLRLRGLVPAPVGAAPSRAERHRAEGILQPAPD